MSSSDLSLLISFASATAACIAAAISFISLSIAKESQLLNQQSFERKSPKISIHLNKANYLETDEDNRIYAYSISISNGSESKNSIIRLELTIKYKILDTDITAKIDNDCSLHKYFELGPEAGIKLPCMLDSYGAVSGWAFFRIDNSVFKDRLIENYELNLTDSNRNSYSVQAILIENYASAKR